jgi:hypothetical protein
MARIVPTGYRAQPPERQLPTGIRTEGPTTLLTLCLIPGDPTSRAGRVTEANEPSPPGRFPEGPKTSSKPQKT